jgi:HEAT repeat protein
MRIQSICVAIAMLFSVGAMAQDAQSVVQTELTNAVLKQDMRENVLATNRMIALGEAAVDPLSKALSDSRTDLRAKWAAAQALGEIGSANGLAALSACEKEDNSWLKSLCKNSAAIIKGEKKRAGKVYLYTIGVQKTRTDVEAGTTVVVP